jgi:acyl carrier protein
MSNEQTVKQFLISNFLPDVSAADIADEYDLLENGVVDSLGLLTLISWVEDHFGLSVDDEDLSPDKFRSVKVICEFVDRAHAAMAGS